MVQTRHGVGTVVVPASADRLAAGSPRLVSNTVAVLIAGLDPFYLSLLRGVEDVAAERGTLVLLADTQTLRLWLRRSSAAWWPEVWTG